MECAHNFPDQKRYGVWKGLGYITKQIDRDFLGKLR